MKIQFELAGIAQAAREVLTLLKNQQASVLALVGGMGSGKTTFTSALLEALGSRDTVNSPTFSIINQYADAAGSPVYHMDLYRLRDEEEAIQAGIEDCFYSGCLCIVEWPEKAAALLPEDSVYLYWQVQDDGSRVLSTEIQY